MVKNIFDILCGMMIVLTAECSNRPKRAIKISAWMFAWLSAWKIVCASLLYDWPEETPIGDSLFAIFVAGYAAFWAVWTDDSRLRQGFLLIQYAAMLAFLILSLFALQGGLSL